MEIDRRGFLALGALAAVAATPAGGARAAPVTLDVVRICNTAYYPADEGLHLLAPGTPLEVRFEYDPAWVQQASTGFFLNGAKVGDAPRLQREMLGRMLLDGRRLDAVVDHVRPPTAHDGHAVRVAVRLDRSVFPRPLPIPASRDPFWKKAEGFEAERFVRLVGEGSGFGAHLSGHSGRRRHGG